MNIVDDEDGGPDVALKNLTNPQNNEGVESFIVMNEAGIAIKASNNLSTKIQGQQPVPNEKAAHYAANISHLLTKVKASVKLMDTGKSTPEDELQSIRLRTKDNEIIVVPAEKYTLIVIHKPFKKDEKKQQKKEEKQKRAS
mmetsp:Transcript_4860/g.8846  ORF Transcript_4860/g.8846 Transcript_4860/m.8846 type:complete len:141 (-) Transcript_4860:242-664(-)|eukprot:CAMPEP_0197541014 /NCGR_PEP_ID=MMETSP1318-20131121/66923_1 /TAXON_ID=552666 /ORGANISM="Partenskyella glossopodia, Strain RCC365" /LENGTH=140 /DNA_ID=CAMNT_0043100139 /DNA_START=941 /DNA_END=1363 /DNA_ORIENTATION=-